MDYNLNVDLHPVHNLPMTIALPPIPSTTSAATAPDSQNQSLAMCDNVSQLSDYSDAPKVKQDIGQAASGTIGRCFLNSYNRAMTWVNILQLKRPQPLHTITAIQQLSSQAEEVLQMLFSVGCLPGKTGQTTLMQQDESDESETDLFSASYSIQLWKTLGPKGFPLRPCLGPKLHHCSSLTCWNSKSRMPSVLMESSN